MEQIYFFRLLTVYAVNSVFTKGVADSFRLFYTFVCALLFLQHFQEKQDLGLPVFPSSKIDQRQAVPRWIIRNYLLFIFFLKN